MQRQSSERCGCCCIAKGTGLELFLFADTGQRFRNSACWSEGRSIVWRNIHKGRLRSRETAPSGKGYCLATHSRNNKTTNTVDRTKKSMFDNCLKFQKKKGDDEEGEDEEEEEEEIPPEEVGPKFQEVVVPVIILKNALVLACDTIFAGNIPARRSG